MPGTKNVAANIKELHERGTKPRSDKQIIAIAYSQARVAGNKLKAGKRK